MQFGFRDGLSTDIAVMLVHDVIQRCNHLGSPVYACSLDAEGAFDAIPHSVLFTRPHGAIPDPLWRLLVQWYRRLNVQIKWHGQRSETIAVRQGTRQGGLSSPFLFNHFYKGMVEHLNTMVGGIRIQGNRYSVFCYADDLLLTSVSATGLQSLINAANTYTKSEGLRFNPKKTVCCVFGKPALSDMPKRTLEGDSLTIEGRKEIGVLRHSNTLVCYVVPTVVPSP